VDALKFATGKSWTEYLNSITRNRDRFEAAYKSFFLAEEDIAPFRAATPLNIVAIGEDWCPDVFQTLGFIAKLADAVPGLILRIFERDTHPELMDRYLSEGRKRIPVYAFFDHNFEEVFWWSGRNKAADEWVSSVRKGRAYEEIPADEMEEFRKEFDRRYEESYARENLREITEGLREAIARKRH
jgi:hypothetical protein